MTDTAIIKELPDFSVVNLEIMQQFNQYRDSDEIRRTHYFAGRYENIYLDLEKIPAMQNVMDQAHRYAQQILKIDQELKRGFWFNLMMPGQVTQSHTHDDDDECLSAVYYIDTPQDSGDLLLNTEADVFRVQPQAGKFVFFSPDIPHEVTENKSNFERLSVGMNFGIDLD